MYVYVGAQIQTERWIHSAASFFLAAFLRGLSPQRCHWWHTCCLCMMSATLPRSWWKPSTSCFSCNSLSPFDNISARFSAASARVRRRPHSLTPCAAGHCCSCPVRVKKVHAKQALYRSRGPYLTARSPCLATCTPTCYL